ncbi:hypothetical protein J2Z83_003937 [Virgibacillus natechei]|uniref:Uncharacterized protein n=1 Tax=Virgibacillus natechei TaxID=1216297 RepID=A0ABS4ILD3_9BACI|nr:hypothetical protein [Virgibacillus natechei]MBP1971782.1 hypothetical protein [Virgibacillus natechei]UZD12888.1 hypothetical protein OLD84_18715 [Virgibacillus natechei]
MKQISKKKPIVIMMILFFIAGLLDMKYKGLFYQLLQKFRVF